MFKSLFTLFFLVSSFVSYAQPDYSVRNISTELLKNSNSVLFDEYIEVDVSQAGKMVYSSHRAVTVLNAKGDKNAYAQMEYDNDSKVNKAEAYVYDALGKEVKHFKKRDFKDISASDGSIYSDDRLLYLNYNPSSYPYTLVFDVEYESRSTAFVYGWMAIDNYAASTKKSVYKLIFNPNNKPRYHTTNFEGFNISITENPTSFIFEATDLKAIEYEELSQSFSNIRPMVHVGLDQFYLKGVSARARNWAEFGSWMQNGLLHDVAELPEGTKQMARNLVAGESTNEGKARLIYQYLQDKVRYISVQIGIGGWKPMLAEEVDQLAYGDCKALTNYTKALLDVVGVPSYYTILYAGDNELNILEEFSSMQGNHAILGVPDGDEIYWLECTSQDKPFGFTGNFTDDRDVLVITPEGGKIMHTKVYPDEENLREYNATVRLKENGTVEGDFEGKYQGLQYDGKYLWHKKTNEEKTTAYKEKWDYINGLTIGSIDLIDNKLDIIFSEKLTLSASNYATNIGDDLLFCANVFNRSGYIPPRITERTQELYISEGYKDIDHLEILIPDNYAIDSLPKDTSIETKFGTYSISFTAIAKNKIGYSRTMVLRKGTYSPEDYKAYRAFRKKIAKLDKSKILLKLKTT